MARIRGRGNRATELVLLSMMRSAAIKGWRRHLALPGRPDFAFPVARLAVFVDGCFWHRCPVHFIAPRTRAEFWEFKIASNRRRDLRAGRELRRRGWRVIRIWEHDLRSDRRLKTLNRLKKVLGMVN